MSHMEDSKQGGVEEKQEDDSTRVMTSISGRILSPL